MAGEIDDIKLADKASRRRAQKAAASLAYYYRNREKEAARQRTWREANPEAQKARNAKQRAGRTEADQENIQARERARHYEKRDENVARMRVYYEANHDALNAARRIENCADAEAHRESRRNYFAKNEAAREARNARGRAYWAVNKEALSQKNKERYAANRDGRLSAVRQWRLDNLDRAKATLKAWREANPGYANKRYHESPTALLEHRLRARLTAALNRVKAKKMASFISLVGCSLEMLRAHIEAQFVDGMTWENHGEWHVDHIRPVCTFSLDDPEQQFACFCYLNLRPLWALHNLSRPRKNWRPPEGIAA